MGGKKHRKHMLEAMESKIVEYHASHIILGMVMAMETSMQISAWSNKFYITFVIFKQLIESPRET